MIPCKPDHPFVYWATYSYIGEMVEAGAKCYVYDNGFLHAKTVMVDGTVVCVGTANMDFRSFGLNFEVNAVVYSEETTQKLEQSFENDMTKSTQFIRFSLFFLSVYKSGDSNLENCSFPRMIRLLW